MIIDRRAGTHRRIAVAMSGGLDSSVAAGILKAQGHDVVGLTMKVFTDESRCCSLEQVLQAKRVAEFLSVRHYSLNLTEFFKKEIIDHFIHEYLAGRTPNPCVVCNQRIKFGALLRRARELDCSALATGHYARVEHGARHRLLRASDQEKSQAYFLAMLSQESLSYSMFPLGDLAGEDVKRLAEKMQLPLKETRSSQEICFVPEEGHADFIARETGTGMAPGPLLDRNGDVVGEHAGYVRYTIGQRKGLGVAFGSPRYVIDILPERNAVVIGEERDLLARGLIARNPNWIALEKLDAPKRVYVKIRYGAAPVPATVHPSGSEELEVIFETQQKAVARGQLVVFYDDDLVLGGAWIEKKVED
jgi:tRNA-specific 2-thiouridylase